MANTKLKGKKVSIKNIKKLDIPVKKTTIKKVYRTAFNVANTVAVAADVGKTVIHYANGRITRSECVEQLGEKGVSYVISYVASKPGAAVGGVLGSALGSVVPGVGTAAGASAGAAAGEIIGDMVGYKAGTKISRAVTKAVKDKKE